jgi:hypothetical protein
MSQSRSISIMRKTGTPGDGTGFGSGFQVQHAGRARIAVAMGPAADLGARYASRGLSSRCSTAKTGIRSLIGKADDRLAVS